MKQENDNGYFTIDPESGELKVDKRLARLLLRAINRAARGRPGETRPPGLD